MNKYDIFREGIDRKRARFFFLGFVVRVVLDISVGSVCDCGDRVRAVALWVKVRISGPLRCFVF